jgi:hypothetical protein
MSTFFFPKLDASNYQSFRRLINDEMPETFNEWSQRQSLKKDQYLLNLHPDRLCVDIEINPDQFSKYCRSTNSSNTLDTLDRLAAEIGSRESQSG